MDFEDKLQEQLDKLPYEKHLDDGQYNDGQLNGFEAGARWAFALYNKNNMDTIEKMKKRLAEAKEKNDAIMLQGKMYE